MHASTLRSPDVSFVVPCFKSRRTIGRTLECIFSQHTGESFEVIVVDSSQDSTSKWIRRSFPKVKVLSSKVRLSPGAARNLGVRQATGSYLAFLDADTAPSPEWLDRLLATMKNRPDIRVISGTLQIGNPEAISARVLHWIEFSEFVTGGRPGFKSHLSSSNFLIRKTDFLEAGGFDERFVMAEDLLFSRSFAGKLYLETATSVRHYYRSGWVEATGHLRKLGFWSGRFRRSVKTGGNWLRTVPLASFALPPIRGLLIVWRVGRRDFLEGLKALAHFPLIVMALYHWAVGLYRGLREYPYSEAD